MAKITDKTSQCDKCGAKGTYQEVGRGNALVQGTELGTFLLLGEICQKCAVKIIKLIVEN